MVLGNNILTKSHMKKLIIITFWVLFLCSSTTKTLFGQSWQNLHKVTASDKDSTAYYGLDVSISGDYAVVGAHMVSSAYVLYNDEGKWIEIKKLEGDPLSHGFGHSVFIDKDFIVVGAYGEDKDSTSIGIGAAYVFGKDIGGSNNWGMVKKIIPNHSQEDSWFGWKVSLSGSNLLISSFAEEAKNINGNIHQDAGKAYLFGKNHGGANNWGLVKSFSATVPKQNGGFGVNSVLKGDFAFIWSPMDVLGYMYYRNAGGLDNWGLIKEIRYNGIFSDKSEVSVDLSDEYLVIGNIGRDACIYQKNSGGNLNWGFVKKVKENSGGFGSSVSVSGKYILIGAKSEMYDSQEQNPLSSSGSIYIYENKPERENSWELIKKVTAPDRQKDFKFGISSSLDGNNAIVGAYEANGTGSVYFLNAFDNVIPGSFLELSISKMQSDALLKWKNELDTDVSYFDVQKSNDAEDWVSIGKVVPSNSGIQHSYFFTDKSVQEGMNFYRIIEMSKTKSARVSTVKVLSAENRVETIIYPNPAVNKFYVYAAHLNTIKSIKIINSLGFTVTETSSITEGVSTKALTPGIYTVQFTNLDGTLDVETLAVTN